MCPQTRDTVLVERPKRHRSDQNLVMIALPSRGEKRDGP